MKTINETKRSRLKMLILFGTILTLLTVYSIHSGMEGPATLGMTGIGALVAKYSHDETKKPSIKNKKDEIREG